MPKNFNPTQRRYKHAAKVAVANAAVNCGLHARANYFITYPTWDQRLLIAGIPLAKLRTIIRE